MNRNLLAAISYLGAEKVRGRWYYYDEAMRRWYRTSRPALLDLGRRWHADRHSQPYSRWCADWHADPMPRQWDPSELDKRTR